MAIVDYPMLSDEQIRLENRLAQVQSQGAQAVRLVTMQATIEKLRRAARRKRRSIRKSSCSTPSSATPPRRTSPR